LTQDVELFIAIAEIAGVFVGFGALISLTRRDSIEFSQLARLQGVVSIGLIVMVAALIPVGFNLYGLTNHDLWFVCSLTFLILVWAMSLLPLRKAEYRKLMADQTRDSPFSSMFFWLLLEAPIHISLILTILGLYPDLELAFYSTALLFHLFEAAFVLAQIVYSQMRTSTKPDDPEESHLLVH
jgi:hypothetical protein